MNLTVAAWPSPGALGGVGLAPGIGVDVDDVAVLGDAIDEGHDAGRARKDCAPLLVGQVGRDDGGNWRGQAVAPLSRRADVKVAPPSVLFATYFICQVFQHPNESGVRLLVGNNSNHVDEIPTNRFEWH